MDVMLHGYRYSVYSWIARLALAAKGVEHGWTEVDPFSGEAQDGCLNPHPFNRVPSLTHGDFALYETSAITRYVDEAFDGPPLQPDDAERRARVAQVISIVDAYVYRPLVRGVFAHGVFVKRIGGEADADRYREGLAEAPRVLDALEALAGEALMADGDPTLADIHLAPMISYFAEDEEGRALLRARGRLDAWFARASAHSAFRETRPALP